MAEAKKIFGIDLGTTYSCISYVDESGKPVVVKNMEGYPITPSVVYFESPTNVVVGQSAKDSASLFPDQTISFIKRSMGKPGFSFTYNDKQLSPEEVSAYILKKLVGDAEKQLGTEIKDVIITHPAYFGINEREATKNAGIIAGLNVCSLVDEPVAAAYTYGCMNEEQDGSVILVYDLGGGTFDVTMIEITPDQVKVICTGGDANLGGKLWDDAIINYIINKFEEQTGVSADEMLADSETMQDLMIRAEDAKKQLSSKDKHMVPISFNGEKARIEITREKFNEITADLLSKTVSLTKEMLEEARKKGYEKFDKMLLVGGSTRMPQVAEAIQKEFGIEPQMFDPDEAVAKGAALFGYAHSGRKVVNEIIDGMIKSGEVSKDEVFDSEGNVDLSKLDTAKKAAIDNAMVSAGFTIGSAAVMHKPVPVTSKSFGIQAFDQNNVERLFNVILKNTNVPCDSTQRFGTHEANQQSVEILIYESEVSDVVTELDMGVKLGEALLEIPQGLPAGSPIDVTFTLNAEGLLEMRAVEVTQLRECHVQIQVTNGLTEQQVQDAISSSRGIQVQ